MCRGSKGQDEVRNYLATNRIDFEEELAMPGCKSPKGYTLRVDFYIKSSNTIIEFDGIHHFKPITFGSGETPDQKFARVKECDLAKNLYCKLNSINLIRVPYTELGKVDKFLQGKL